MRIRNARCAVTTLLFTIILLYPAFVSSAQCQPERRTRRLNKIGLGAGCWAGLSRADQITNRRCAVVTDLCYRSSRPDQCLQAFARRMKLAKNQLPEQREHDRKNLWVK